MEAQANNTRVDSAASKFRQEQEGMGLAPLLKDGRRAGSTTSDVPEYRTTADRSRIKRRALDTMREHDKSHSKSKKGRGEDGGRRSKSRSKGSRDRG